MYRKRQKAVSLWLGLASVAGLGVALGVPEDARSASNDAVVARPYSNVAAYETAGFPATALNVNRDQFGRLSWMMTPQEIGAQKRFEQRYLAPARKKVAASIADGSLRASSSLFGVQDASTLTISGVALAPDNQAVVYDRNVESGTLTCGLGVLEDDFAAQVHLPAGALITGMTVYGQDNSILNDPSFAVYQYCNAGAGPQLGSIPVTASVTSGYSGGPFAVASAATSHTVDNSDCAYTFVADFASGLTCDAGTNMHIAAIRWKRQISPAPAVETFADVQFGEPFHREVEALVASGITAGCGGGNYCPEDPVTRGQMAAFLSRALGLHWQDN